MGRYRGGRARRSQQLAEANLLDLTPVREAEWTDVDGCIVLQRPPPRRRGLLGMAAHLSYLMAARRIRLDDIGSWSWRYFDGRTTVSGVCAELRNRFGARRL